MTDLFFEVKTKQVIRSAQRDKTAVLKSTNLASHGQVLIDFSQALTNDNIDELIAQLEDDKYFKKKDVILSVIENDEAAPKDLNKEAMAGMIMKASLAAGVSPLMIASIAKQESHFNQNVPTANGTGIMQITTMSVEDMFLRAKIYDDDINKHIKKYGSLEKVFKAKQNNSSIYLGKFGEMLYKYKTPKRLMIALKKDSELNIEAGAYIYKVKLKQANGDEAKALELYNGSPIKVKYAKAVLKNITEIRRNECLNTIS